MVTPEATNDDAKIWGFVGAGKMATALMQGMLNAGVTKPAQLRASDPSPASAKVLSELVIASSPSNKDLAKHCHVIVLAVKPQSMPQVLGELEPELSSEHLVISVAAGVSLATLAAGLGPKPRLVRVMPNTPALVGEGASAFCLGPNATERDERAVNECLASIGRVLRVPESMLDAVTGLSGSGPAFVYVIIEALADGGVRSGLPRDAALLLAAQTVLGSAKMVLETGKHPGVLKDEVASPGGTTIAGLHALERGGIRAALMDAVEAATKRSAELAEIASRTSWT